MRPSGRAATSGAKRRREAPPSTDDNGEERCGDDGLFAADVNTKPAEQPATGKPRKKAARSGATEATDGVTLEKEGEYCRKERSLGLLCTQFMGYCVGQAVVDYTINLDAVAKAIEIERRRIYDVTNILEALDIVSRKNKNAYVWHGTGHLATTIKKLRDSALVDLCEAADVPIVPTATLMAQPERRGRFYGDVLTQPIGALVPIHPQFAASAAGSGASSRSGGGSSSGNRTSWSDRDCGIVADAAGRPSPPSSGLCLFGDPLLAYLSSPPHWLYPVHVAHQSAAAAGFSSRGAPTLNAVGVHAPLTAGRMEVMAIPFCDMRWPIAVRSLAQLAKDGKTGSMYELCGSTASYSDSKLLQACNTPEWLPEDSALECSLEEVPFPRPVKLRSLPLLSEVMALSGNDAEATSDLASISFVGGGIAVHTKRHHRRDRSLGVLTQRFIKLFLLDRKVVTLEFASPLVIGGEEGSGDMCGGSDMEGALVLPFVDEEGSTCQSEDVLARHGSSGTGRSSSSSYSDGTSPSSSSTARMALDATKSVPISECESSPLASPTAASNTKKGGRRLYDIANVLVALGILDRVNVRVGSTRRSAFRWRGPAYVVWLPGAPLPLWAIRKIAPPLAELPLLVRTTPARSDGESQHNRRTSRTVKRARVAEPAAFPPLKAARAPRVKPSPAAATTDTGAGTSVVAGVVGGKAHVVPDVPRTLTHAECIALDRETFASICMPPPTTSHLGTATGAAAAVVKSSASATGTAKSRPLSKNQTSRTGTSLVASMTTMASRITAAMSRPSASASAVATAAAHDVASPELFDVSLDMSGCSDQSMAWTSRNAVLPFNVNATPMHAHHSGHPVYGASRGDGAYHSLEDIGIAHEFAVSASAPPSTADMDTSAPPSQYLDRQRHHMTGVLASALKPDNTPFNARLHSTRRKGKHTVGFSSSVVDHALPVLSFHSVDMQAGAAMASHMQPQLPSTSSASALSYTPGQFTSGPAPGMSAAFVGLENDASPGLVAGAYMSARRRPVVHIPTGGSAAVVGAFGASSGGGMEELGAVSPSYFMASPPRVSHDAPHAVSAVACIGPPSSHLYLTGRPKSQSRKPPVGAPLQLDDLSIAARGFKLLAEMDREAPGGSASSHARGSSSCMPDLAGSAATLIHTPTTGAAATPGTSNSSGLDLSRGVSIQW